MSTANWQAMINCMLEPVCLVDGIDLTLSAINDSAAELLGRPVAELLHKPVVEILRTPDDLAFWEKVAEGIADNTCSLSEVITADGRIVPVERRVSCVRLEQESVQYVVSLRSLDARLTVEQELEEVASQLRATLDSTADGILMTDMAGCILAHNQRFAELWALPTHLLEQKDDLSVQAWMRHAVVDQRGYSDRLSMIQRSPLLDCKDVLTLREGTVLERFTLPQYANGKPVGRVYAFRDITHKEDENADDDFSARVFDNSPEAIFVTAKDGQLVAVNPAFIRMTGYTQDELLALAVSDLLATHHDKNKVLVIGQALTGEGVWNGEVSFRHHNGQVLPCMLSFVGNMSHLSGGCIGFVRDLTDVTAARKRIEELLYRDALTGMPNRAMLEERFSFILSYAQRNNTSFAVLFIDMDHFKHINDSLGHDFGDRVLVHVAERLSRSVRRVDMAARLGGDEFLILLTGANARGAEASVRRILASLAEPICIDDMSFTMTCSIGVALYPDDGATMSELIKNADSAMYAVKERGRSDFRFYQRHMNVGLLSRMKLEQKMRVALEEGQFRLHYQPQIDMQTGCVNGAEALLRWTDPELGDVPPGKFIPVAEESMVIVPLGAWVLNEALRQIAEWLSHGLRLTVAVNVSALQFQQSGFVEQVADALARSEVPPELLELELTESVLVNDVDETLRRLQALHDLGVQLAIDDFGTGYSSFAYLRRFPIHKLKIDQAFVRGVPAEASDAAIVTAMVGVGKALGKHVVAEGVETEEQYQFLLSNGCAAMQGFLFSRAIPPVEFEQRFSADNARWTLMPVALPATGTVPGSDMRH